MDSIEDIQNVYFFGCWNNFNNKDAITPIYSHVIDKLNKQVKKNDILFILGDNYYSKKVHGARQFVYDELKDGFDKLNLIKINKYIIFGNHDLEDYSFSYTNNGLPCPCPLTKFEYLLNNDVLPNNLVDLCALSLEQSSKLTKLLKKSLSLPLTPLSSPKLLKSSSLPFDEPRVDTYNNNNLKVPYGDLLVNDSHAIFFIDTNLYEKKYSINEDKYESSCYKRFGNSFQEIRDKIE